MKKRIKAIPTSYAGETFRSKLEARWASVFNALGVEWVYEPEGYEICFEGRKIWYLPDFYFPAFDLFGEVKGLLTDKDAVKMRGFAVTTGRPLLVFSDLHKLKFRPVESLRESMENIEWVEHLLHLPELPVYCVTPDRGGAGACATALCLQCEEFNFVPFVDINSKPDEHQGCAYCGGIAYGKLSAMDEHTSAIASKLGYDLPEKVAKAVCDAYAEVA